MAREAIDAASATPLGMLLDFIHRLDAAHITYRLESARDAIMVSVAGPGQRWEFEFFADGDVEAECFVSNAIEQATPEFIEEFAATWGEN